MQLFYRTEGEGELLVILHGLFGISDNWAGIAKGLSSKFRVITPDLRNHGRSPHSDAFGYYPMCNDLTELFDDLRIDKVSIIGHSMGGKLAMHFAVQNPEMVEKLVVVDISPLKTEVRQTHLKIIEAMNSLDFDNIRSRQEAEQAIAEHIKQKPLQLFILKNLVRIDNNRFAWRLNLKGIESNVDEIMEGVPADAYFSKPTLFIRGEQSDYIKDEDVEVIDKMFGDYRISTITGAGHWLHADKPQQLLSALFQFL